MGILVGPFLCPNSGVYEIGETMTRIEDILDVNELQQNITSGHITARHHDGRTIYNYTPKAQYERHWNHTTRTCRGLIVEDGEVIARPFPKFFNYGELEGINLDTPVTVYDKLDGSLGIAYPADGSWKIATRGSMQSEQAVWATAFLTEHFPDPGFEPGVTYLFEIIYPDNRIVVDYGTRTDLVLLGGVEIATGDLVSAYDLPWDGEIVEVFNARTFRDALALPERPGQEGLVIRINGTNELVKVKQDDYVRLHKIVTGWNEKTVWEWLSEGRDIAEIIADVPDEFHAWVKEVSARLAEAHTGEVSAATREHVRIIASLPDGWTRRDYAAQASQSPWRGALFMLLDNRSIDTWAWDRVKPKGEAA